MTKYQINGNLSEKQIEADVAGYFGWISKSTPFRLLDIDESLTGADKKFYDLGFAFFMQFKVSKGLKAVIDVPLSTRKNRSKLEEIREFRHILGLYDNPTLYFKLHKQSTTASDLQHNILMNYANKRASQAFYVAPLQLDKDSYYSTLFNSVHRYQQYPFANKTKKIYERDWVSHISHIPFLKEHISIIPHERVTTHEHYYSFSPTGNDIAWHSPTLISNNVSRLSDVMSKSINNCINEKLFVNLENIESLLDEKVENLSISSDLTPIENIQNKAQKLYKSHNIRLILLLANSQYIRKT